jgi:hypothetical protein
VPRHGLQGAARERAMRAIVARLAEQLRDACLPRPLAADPDRQPPCPLYEATPPTDWAPCGKGFAGREWATDGITLAVLREMRQLGMCGDGGLPCTAVSVCALPPLPPGPNREACLHDLVRRVSTSGWCYIDAMADRNGDGEQRGTRLQSGVLRGGGNTHRRPPPFGRPAQWAARTSPPSIASSHVGAGYQTRTAKATLVPLVAIP